MQFQPNSHHYNKPCLTTSHRSVIKRQEEPARQWSLCPRLRRLVIRGHILTGLLSAFASFSRELWKSSTWNQTSDKILAPSLWPKNFLHVFFHPTSPWWSYQLEGIYLSRQMHIQSGRSCPPSIHLSDSPSSFSISCEPQETHPTEFKNRSELV